MINRCIAIWLISYLQPLVLLVSSFYFQQMMLKEETETYKAWQNTPVPTFNKFYFFNVTNGFDVERNGAKPIVNEVGPFVYQMHLQKHSLIHNSNGTISYFEKKIWTFQPHLSVSDEMTIINTLNAPLVITLSMLQTTTPAVRVLVTLALDAVTEGFFIKRTVKQLLFEGYPDMLTNFGPLLNPDIPRNTAGRFGYMLNKNASNDGVYTVHSGVRDMNMINFIDRYKGLNHLNYWSSEECNSLANSSTGQIWSIDSVKNYSAIRLFTSDVCRVLELNYNQTYKISDDLSVQRFMLNSKSFKNSIDFPPNVCFMSRIRAPQPLFPPRESRNQVRQSTRPFPSGVFDISTCKFGAPILISEPHFLNGDNYFLATIVGLRPNHTKHGFWIDIDPFTGASVSLAARLQINVAINKGQGSVRYRNIPDIVFPIFWEEVTMTLTPRYLHKLISAKTLPNYVASVSFYTLIGLGTTILVITIFLFMGPKFQQFKVNHSDLAAIDPRKEVSLISKHKIIQICDTHLQEKREIWRQKFSFSPKVEGIDNPSMVST